MENTTKTPSVFAIAKKQYSLDTVSRPSQAQKASSHAQKWLRRVTIPMLAQHGLTVESPEYIRAYKQAAHEDNDRRKTKKKPSPFSIYIRLKGEHVKKTFKRYSQAICAN